MFNLTTKRAEYKYKRLSIERRFSSDVRKPTSQYWGLGQVGFPTEFLRFPAGRFLLFLSLRCHHYSELDHHWVRTSIPVGTRSRSFLNTPWQSSLFCRKAFPAIWIASANTIQTYQAFPTFPPQGRLHCTKFLPNAGSTLSRSLLKATNLGLHGKGSRPHAIADPPHP